MSKQKISNFSDRRFFPYAEISEHLKRPLYDTQGLGGNWFMKKIWSRKSRGTVPFKKGPKPNSLAHFAKFPFISIMLSICTGRGAILYSACNEHLGQVYLGQKRCKIENMYSINVYCRYCCINSMSNSIYFSDRLCADTVVFLHSTHADRVYIFELTVQCLYLCDNSIFRCADSVYIFPDICLLGTVNLSELSFKVYWTHFSAVYTFSWQYQWVYTYTTYKV